MLGLLSVGIESATEIGESQKETENTELNHRQLTSSLTNEQNSPLSLQEPDSILAPKHEKVFPEISKNIPTSPLDS